ncbi:hypothetical protein VTO73DRAFT_13310 [Trametes versicolor]
MKDTFDEHVAIFWDYENCTPPSTGPGYDVVNNIRQIALEYGSVKLFKAYLELSEQSSSKTIGLRSELQSCGVSLTDCPHNGRKDVADKMMIVDMLTYAIDNPAPATVVLISGDRDFVYAVSVLRLRRYRVVVVAPNSAHASLKSQASVVLDWEVHIMRRTLPRLLAPEANLQAPTDDVLHRSPRRPPLTFGGTLPPVTPKSHRRPSFRAAASAPIAGLNGGAGTSGGVSFQGHHRSSSGITDDGCFLSGPAHMADRPFYPAAERQTVVPSAIEDEDDEEEAISAARQSIPDIVDVIEDLQGRIGRNISTSKQHGIPATVAEALSHPVPFNQPAPVLGGYQSALGSSLSSQSALSSSSTRGNTEEHDRPSPPANSTALKVPQPCTVPFPVCVPPFVRPATVEPITRLSRLCSPSLVAASPPERPTPSPKPPTVEVATEPSRSAHLSVAQVTLSQSVAKQAAQPSPVAVATNAKGPTSPDTVVKIPSAPPLPPPSKVVIIPDTVDPPPKAPRLPIPQKYELLVRVLKESKARGVEWASRSHVAEQLKQLDQKVYSKAGVTSFKKYSAAAASDGIVILGGSLAQAWITLSPDYDG